MKVLVTGAKGMLGQDLCPILEDYGFEVIETDCDTLDITNELMIKKVFEETQPDYVVHCAAYTNVDKAEEDIETATKINVSGTEYITKACAKLDIPILYISPDYVFNGEKQTPYLTTDTPSPINNYGFTKYQGEEIIKKFCNKYFITRTSWLYGHHGKNFVETMISLKDKDVLKVVDDQIGCPTWTVELATAITGLLQTENYGTYHVCGSGSTSWYGFAKEIFDYLGLEVNLQPCATSEFPRPAKRPHYSVMENNKVCRFWKDALHDYLDLRIEE